LVHATLLFVTRGDLAIINGQLQPVKVPASGEARFAAEAFNGWLEAKQERLRRAVAFLVRHQAVPQGLVQELRQAAASAATRRGELRSAYGDVF